MEPFNHLRGQSANFKPQKVSAHSLSLSLLCCSLPDMDSCSNHQTSYTDINGGRVEFLDRQTVSCGSSGTSLVTRFQAQHSTGSNIRYNFKCCNFKASFCSHDYVVSKESLPAPFFRSFAIITTSNRRSRILLPVLLLVMFTINLYSNEILKRPLNSVIFSNLWSLLCSSTGSLWVCQDRISLPRHSQLEWFWVC